jgi:enoyl-CoA hydratase
MTHADVVVEAGIGTLTITDAKSANVLGSPVVADLRAALADLAATDLRVLVLRGTGDKAFVAGADIHEMAGLEPSSAEVFIDGLRALCEAVRLFPVPVVARLPGWTLGAGLELALACDLRIAADDARFGMPEIALGIPSVIHAALLPRSVGAARAARMLLTGEPVGAATALAWGLVDEMVPLDGLDAAVAAHAARFAGFGPHVVRQQKRLLREWSSQTVEEATVASVREFGAAFATGEPARYLRSFVEGRGARG